MTPTAKAIELLDPLRQALDQVRATVATHRNFDPAKAKFAEGDTGHLVFRRRHRAGTGRDQAVMLNAAMERGTRLGEAVRESFAQAGAPFQPTVEVRYCNTACVLAAAGVGAAVVDPFSPRQSGGQDLVVRPFTPRTVAVAYMLWSEAEPPSRLAKAFLNEVRQASRGLDRDAS